MQPLWRHTSAHPQTFEALARQPSQALLRQPSSGAQQLTHQPSALPPQGSSSSRAASAPPGQRRAPTSPTSEAAVPPAASRNIQPRPMTDGNIGGASEEPRQQVAGRRRAVRIHSDAARPPAQHLDASARPEPQAEAGYPSPQRQGTWQGLHALLDDIVAEQAPPTRRVAVMQMEHAALPITPRQDASHAGMHGGTNPQKANSCTPLAGGCMAIPRTNARCCVPLWSASCSATPQNELVGCSAYPNPKWAPAGQVLTLQQFGPQQQMHTAVEVQSRTSQPAARPLASPSAGNRRSRSAEPVPRSGPDPGDRPVDSFGSACSRTTYLDRTARPYRTPTGVATPGSRKPG